MVQHSIHYYSQDINGGLHLLATIHLKLQRLKYNIISFGGINIIFVGDCLQFPSINDMPLH